MIHITRLHTIHVFFLFHAAYIREKVGSNDFGSRLVFNVASSKGYDLEVITLLEYCFLSVWRGPLDRAT
jgi:hypothetical protein